MMCTLRALKFVEGIVKGWGGELRFAKRFGRAFDLDLAAQLKN
jgi:hypothetical protein